MTHPFELTAVQLQDRLDEMVEVTFGDGAFLLLPTSPAACCRSVVVSYMWFSL